jgi:hypothetical protein
VLLLTSTSVRIQISSRGGRGANDAGDVVPKQVSREAGAAVVVVHPRSIGNASSSGAAAVGDHGGDSGIQASAQEGSVTGSAAAPVKRGPKKEVANATAAASSQSASSFGSRSTGASQTGRTEEKPAKAESGAEAPSSTKDALVFKASRKSGAAKARAARWPTPLTCWVAQTAHQSPTWTHITYIEEEVGVVFDLSVVYKYLVATIQQHELAKRRLRS